MLSIDIGSEFWLKQNAGIANEPAYDTIAGFISRVLPNIYVVASIILFFLLIAGGLLFIVSAGSGKEEGVKKGQQAIMAALIGFLLIFASYWIIQIIQVVSGINILKSTL